MIKVRKIALHFILVILLTVLTQIGGLVLLLSQFVSNRIKYRFKFKNSIVWATLYLIITFAIIPHLAPIWGREKIKHSNRVQPTTYLTILLNRNYVVPTMNNVLQKAAISVPEIEIHYLDACFPFIDGFSLIPHLSHNDGKKIDLSFIYQNTENQITNTEKSRTGYGVYVEPRGQEINQTKRCIYQGNWQYDISKYISLGAINETLTFSETYTKKLVSVIIRQKEVRKIFIEPHLKQRLNLTNSKVRFHGCHAVRHDDHIHIEIE